MKIVEEATWGSCCILIVAGFEEQVRQTPLTGVFIQLQSRAGTVTSEDALRSFHFSSVVIYIYMRQNQKHREFYMLLIF